MRRTRYYNNLAALAPASVIPTLDIKATNGKFMLDNQEIFIKGISWSGTETSKLVVDGLWGDSLSNLLDILEAEKFNLIRIPFSMDMVYNNGLSTQYPLVGDWANPWITGLNCGEALDYIISAMADRGILVMLDCHRERGIGDHIDALWYGGYHNYTDKDAIDIWLEMANRYKNQWNVVALEISNEPYDPVTWGQGDITTDFDNYIKRVGDQIHAISDKYLIFVAGMDRNMSETIYYNWGGFFDETLTSSTAPIVLSTPNKMVLAPHIYDININGSFTPDTAMLDLMMGWTAGVAPSANGFNAPVCMTEWGGDSSDPISTGFMTLLSEYIITNGMYNNVFWMFGPNSSDTGGYLGDDWKTIDTDKQTLLSRVMPNPTKFRNGIVLDYGSAPII